MAQKSRERVISDAERVNTFLKDDVIGGEQGVLTRLERKYYEEFTAAEDTEKRTTAWAKARVLKDFESELRILVDSGEMAVRERDHEDRRRNGPAIVPPPPASR